MNTSIPTPLLAPTSTGVLLHSLIQANPAAPFSYEPDLPEVFCQTLQVCQELRRTVTVAELAARTGHSPAVAGVIITELLALDLVQVVSSPTWTTRLLTWATHARPVPMAGSVIKMLAIGTQTDHIQHALRFLAHNGAWNLQETPRIDIATTHLLSGMHLLTLGLHPLDSTNPVWADVCREVFCAVVITGPDLHDLAMVHASLTVLHQAQVPVVVLVHHQDRSRVYTDVIRAFLGLADHTPVVVGDAHEHEIYKRVMGLCSTLMQGVR